MLSYQKYWEKKTQRGSATNWPIKNYLHEISSYHSKIPTQKKRAFQWYIICGVTVRVKQKSLFLEIWNLTPSLIDDSEDLNLVITMYNLIEYSSNYSETTWSVWFYSKDEATKFNADTANDNNFWK